MKQNVMQMLRRSLYILFFTGLAAGLSSCYENEDLNLPVKTTTPSEDEIDQYIAANYTDAYGVAVRYKFVDRYVDPTKRVTPPRRSVVIPMLEFLNTFWIGPYMEIEGGQEFFQDHVPAEVVFIGSSIYNDDGTITLGTADAGARITLTEVNDVDMDDKAWILRQLGTIYHEFAHIVHQRYALPPNFETISPDGYTSSGSWYNLTDEEALRRGFVSPYGTSSYNEDFAEFVAFLLFDENFYATYIDEEINCTTEACTERNEGRARLRKKYNSIIAHYKQYAGIDLLKLRDEIQKRLNG
jgi:substrate import-associated zinc metallohydrolase lipoprotein